MEKNTLIKKLDNTIQKIKYPSVGYQLNKEDILDLLKETLDFLNEGGNGDLFDFKNALSSMDDAITNISMELDDLRCSYEDLKEWEREIK